jgi:hypothetical protein
VLAVFGIPPPYIITDEVVVPQPPLERLRKVPWFGIEIDDDTDDVAKSLGLDVSWNAFSRVISPDHRHFRRMARSTEPPASWDRGYSSSRLPIPPSTSPFSTTLSSPAIPASPPTQNAVEIVVVAFPSVSNPYSAPITPLVMARPTVALACDIMMRLVSAVPWPTDLPSGEDDPRGLTPPCSSSSVSSTNGKAVSVVVVPPSELLARDEGEDEPMPPAPTPEVDGPPTGREDLAFVMFSNSARSFTRHVSRGEERDMSTIAAFLFPVVMVVFTSRFSPPSHAPSCPSFRRRYASRTLMACVVAMIRWASSLPKLS